MTGDSTAPDVDVMTAAELRVVREWLGLTTRWLAEYLDVAERTVHRWEGGTTPIPDGVRVAVEKIEDDTSRVVSDAVATLSAATEAAILTYQRDVDYRAHHPEQRWPASWHRAVVARVAHEVPGLEIRYWR